MNNYNGVKNNYCIKLFSIIFKILTLNKFIAIIILLIAKKIPFFPQLFHVFLLLWTLKNEYLTQEYLLTTNNPLFVLDVIFPSLQWLTIRLRIGCIWTLSISVHGCICWICLIKGRHIGNGLCNFKTKQAGITAVFWFVNCEYAGMLK